MESKSNETQNFSANLRLLCERAGTVSAVCRKINMNRQQFNKYLTGLHMPSPQNQRLIANHFGLSIPVLSSDPGEFRMLIDGNFFHAMEKLRKLPMLEKFVENMILETTGDHNDLLGVYDRYQFSSIYKGFILRSAFCIYRSNEFLQHYYIERFPNRDNPSKTAYVFKYHGFVMPVSDRIFTADFEGIQQNELTFGVFAQVKRSSSKYMFGICSGIAATMFRQPYSTKVALHYREPGLLRRDDLPNATVLDRSDQTIPNEVLQYLGDGTDMLELH